MWQKPESLMCIESVNLQSLHLLLHKYGKCGYDQIYENTSVTSWITFVKEIYQNCLTNTAPIFSNKYSKCLNSWSHTLWYKNLNSNRLHLYSNTNFHKYCNFFSTEIPLILSRTYGSSYSCSNEIRVIIWHLRPMNGTPFARFNVSCLNRLPLPNLMYCFTF